MALCCSVYDNANMLGVDFLAEDHAALEARKYRHGYCATCIGANLHYAQPELRPGASAPGGVSLHAAGVGAGVE